jgi:HJR/Mrr/RecB family endonuclease
VKRRKNAVTPSGVGSKGQWHKGVSNRGRIHMTSLLDLTPAFYEEAVTNGLNSLGWRARLRKPGENPDADVNAQMGGRRVIVQCPGFVSPIVISAVRDLYEAKIRENVDCAAIVSNAKFTPDALQLALSTGVILLRHDNLAELEVAAFEVGSRKAPPRRGPSVIGLGAVS